MKITCDSCGAKYTIADDKVRGRKVKIRCKGCGTPIVVDGQQEIPSTPPSAQENSAEGAAPISELPPSPGEWSVNLSETDQRTLTTQQIVDGWRDGSIGADAYVWKEGMTDWVPVNESPDLAPLLAAPKKSLAPRATAAATSAATPARAASSRPARVSGGRGQGGMDLFAGVDTAGADDEVDVAVATSAAALPQAGGRVEDQKMTGARNENSVLFSLDALKAGFSGPGPAKPEPKRPNARATAAADDPFGLSAGPAVGAAPMFSLADNNALLTAPAPPPEPPKPVASVHPGYAGEAPKASKKGLLVIGGVALILIAAAGGFVLSAQKDKDAAVAAAASAAAAEKSARDEERKAKEQAEQSAREKEEEERRSKEALAKAEESQKSAATAAPAPPPTGASTDAKPGAAAGAAKPAGGATTAKKEDKKDEPAPAPAGGDQPFSKAAAVSALTAAANSAGSCKKLGGPTGSGKVAITFANSGRVTTANVSGPPFAGTSVGGCVASIFRKAKVPAFSGNPVTVSKGFTIN